MLSLFYTAASRILRTHVRGVALIVILILAAPAFAADTGFKSPTATHSPNEWTNASNAFTSNDSYATSTGISSSTNDQGYATFNLPTVPANSFINGIEVTLEAFSSDPNGDCRLQARLSWNNGSNSTSRKTAILTGSDTVYTLGNATDTWGRTWAVGDFTNGNFVVEVRNDNGDDDDCSDSATISLDHVQVKVFYTEPVPNPELSATCGLDMVLVLDVSTSIDDAEYANMVAAMTTFVTALDGTPTHFALVAFGTEAEVLQGFTDDGSAIIAKMTPRPFSVPSGTQYTNWDDALRAARLLFPYRPNPDLIVFASDGNPNRRGGPSHSDPDPLFHTTIVSPIVSESVAMEWAIQEANAAKTDDIRIIAVGIGNDLDTPNLEAISSPDAVVTADFDTLATALSKVAEELCGGTITVHKVIDKDGNPVTTGDQSDGQGWTFTCSASPDSCDPTSDVTDTEGLIGFEINLGNDTTATVDMTETVKPGFAFVSASCLDKNTTVIGTSGFNTVTGITVQPENIISCTFYNTPLCGNSVVDSGEECDLGYANNGQSGYCCTTSCTFTSSSTVCRSAAGQCDLAENCTGSGATCPPDAFKPNGTTCDDGNAQTVNDQCQNGECEGNLPPAQVCGNGVIEAPETCDDGNTTPGDGCSATCQDECVNPASDCPTAPQCQTAVCEATTGGGAKCGTSNVSNGTSCNDDNACTQTDTCQTGACTGANPVTCTALDQCHSAGTCNPQTGQCSNPAKADETTCSDGNACTQADICLAGVCTGTDPVTCTALDQCHVPGTCNSGTGTCSNPTASNGTQCNDGNPNTTGDACQSGICTGNLPPASVCGNGIIDAGEQCDDGNLKSGDGCSSTCQKECVTPATSCAKPAQCQLAICVATQGGGATCGTNNKANGQTCSDGSTSTKVDQCYAGTCLGGFATPACSPVCGSASCPTPPTIVGTANGEILPGTIGNDIIAGNGGGDYLKAMEGDDCITAGSGNDKIEGHKGKDKIIDSGGTNTINGGENNDCIFTGPGNDTISADEGCDVITHDSLILRRLARIWAGSDILLVHHRYERGNDGQSQTAY